MSTWRDWTEEVDEASGEKYFYNNVTGESSWEAPPGYLAGEQPIRREPTCAAPSLRAHQVCRA